VLFATSTLAARIERAESQTVLDFALQARARGRAVIIEHLCGGVAVYAGPGQPFNKVLRAALFPRRAASTGYRTFTRRIVPGAAR
jgi:hypothetical protein